MMKLKAERTGKGCNPAIDATYTMEPPPRFLSKGKASLDRRNADFTLISNILSHASSSHYKITRKMLRLAICYKRWKRGLASVLTSRTDPTAGFAAAFETRISSPPNLFWAFKDKTKSTHRHYISHFREMLLKQAGRSFQPYSHSEHNINLVSKPKSELQIFICFEKPLQSCY